MFAGPASRLQRGRGIILPPHAFSLDRNGTNQTGLVGGNNIITWTRRHEDHNNLWKYDETAAGWIRFYPPSGKYFVYASIKAQTHTGTGETPEANIFVDNAAVFQGFYMGASASLGAYFTMHNAGIVQIRAGSYMDIRVYMPSTSSILNGDILATFVYGWKVGEYS